MGKEISWNAGDCNRTLKAVRPCECGCDFRDGVSGVGYLTGSNSDGDGFTIWIENEQVYKLLETLLKSDDTVRQKQNKTKQNKTKQNNEHLLLRSRAVFPGKWKIGRSSGSRTPHQ